MSEDAVPGFCDDAQTNNADILIDDFLRRLAMAPPYRPLGQPTTGGVQITDGELSTANSTISRRHLNPEVAATAILIARRLAETPRLMEQIHSGNTWGIVWTSNSALLESVLHVMQHCVLPPRTSLIHEYDLELLTPPIEA